MVTLSPRYLAIRRFTTSGEAKNRRFGDVSNYLVVDNSVVLQRELDLHDAVSFVSIVGRQPGQCVQHREQTVAMNSHVLADIAGLQPSLFNSPIERRLAGFGRQRRLAHRHKQRRCGIWNGRQVECS